MANEGKCETFINKKDGGCNSVVCGDVTMRNSHRNQYGVVTWRWTKGGESGKHSSKTGGGCNSVVCGDAKMRNSHRNQCGGYNLAVDLKRGKCETLLENKWGVVIRWCAET